MKWFVEMKGSNLYIYIYVYIYEYLPDIANKFKWRPIRPINDRKLKEENRTFKTLQFS